MATHYNPHPAILPTTQDEKHTKAETSFFKKQLRAILFSHASFVFCRKKNHISERIPKSSSKKSVFSPQECVLIISMNNY